MKKASSLKSGYTVSALCAGAILIGGCASPNPATLAKLERDNVVYTDQGAVSRTKEEKMRVAVIVSQGDYKDAGEAAKALDGTLVSVLSDFAFFEIVERSNLGALQQETLLANLESDSSGAISIPQADFLITAKMNTFQKMQRKAGLGDLGAAEDGTMVDVVISVDFRFYSLADHKTILAKNIERKYPCRDMSSATSKASVAAQECAKAFVMELGARYAPPARVIETRGDSKVARVSMGTNYGLSKGVKVEFFEYADFSDVIADAQREPSMVGKGTCIESDVKNAWVAVDDYQKTHVKRGHYVRIRSDQSKGFREKMREGFSE